MSAYIYNVIRVAGFVFLSTAGLHVAHAAGFPNEPQTPGELLSGLNAPDQGRTAIIAYHAGTLFTVPEIPASQSGSDYEVRTWDISDATSPVELATWGRTRHPIMAHGYFKRDDYLILGDNFDAVGPWGFRATSDSTFVREPVPGLQCAGTRGCMFEPWLINSYWSYNDVSGNAQLSKYFGELASWDHLNLTGVIGHPFILGDLLIYASDQSRTGVATYDISDPTNPVLLDVLNDGGPGGYWPELWAGGGLLYIVFPYNNEGNGIRIVDATDPTNLRFVTDRALPGTQAMYAQFQDEYAFIGDHKIDMRTFESVVFFDGANTPRTHDAGVGIDISQFALPLGNLLVTGGIGPNQGMAIWAHQAAPDTRPPEVGFHIPQANRSNYPLELPISLIIHETLDITSINVGTTFIVRPIDGNPLSGTLTFAFDDIITFSPDAPLLPNTTYVVEIPANGIADAAGNTMEPFSYTFSTGSSVQGNQAPNVDSFTASSNVVTPGTSLNLSVSASDPDDDALEFRFDFGDGTPKTNWSTQTSTSHVYAEAGHFRARVQVRDAPGTVTSDTLVITSAQAPSGPAPSSSGSLVCASAERTVWTVNPDNNTVTAINADTLDVQFEVNTCKDPRSLSKVGDEIWIACRGDDRIDILSAANGLALGSITTNHGSGPVSIVTNNAGSEVFAALEGSNQIVKYRASDRALLSSLDLEASPRALALSGDGNELYATRFRSALNFAQVWELQTSDLSLARTMDINRFGGQENIDTTAAGRGIANYLTDARLSPDGNELWITANKANDLRGPLTGPDLDSDNMIRNMVFSIDLASGTLARAIDIDNSDSASAVEFSPLADYLFVALQGNNEVVVFDALAFDGAAGNGSLTTKIAADSAPQGLCFDSVNDKLWVKNFLARNAMRLDTNQLLDSGQINISGSSVNTVANEQLTPTVLEGKRIFYNASDERMSAEGYISCASCHLNGDHDGRVWDFTGRGEGLRNTTSLLGRAGMAHGNVHWSGNFDEIQDFENDIRGVFGGKGFLSDSDFNSTNNPLGAAKAGLSVELDALASYVASLDNSHLERSPYRASDGALTAQAQQGQMVFAEEQCASCHSGTTFTDSTVGIATLHDVGTLRTTSGQRLSAPLTGIDTPSLLGLWDGAPYFHDGSAPTLSDVFVVAGGQVIPAEDGVVNSGAVIVDQYTDVNNDNTVRGDAYAQIAGNGGSGTLTLSNINVAQAGVGAVELRVSAWNNQPFVVTVNGVSQQLRPPDPKNEPRWRHTNWLPLRFENVTWNQGSNNELVISTPNNNPQISIDEVVITTAVELSAANAHRRVLNRSLADQQALQAYLLQLEGDVSVDSDGDGISDDADNCQLVSNANQRDTNADGFGNLCDPDLNNDNIVNFIDISLFSASFLGSNADADFNGDGAINFLDFAIMTNYFLLPPGP